MMMKRIWTMLMARNREFFRDRGSMAWTFIFPFLVLLGFYFINGDEKDLYKMGWVGQVPDSFDSRLVENVAFPSVEDGIERLTHHKIDVLVDGQGDKPWKYWISTTSPKSFVAEKLLWAGVTGKNPPELSRQTIQGREIRYIDWLFPGLLGMNIMFNALFGVGYVLVRYRKKGILRRLSVTPLSAFEFLAAQMFSRLFILIVTTGIVFWGCTWIFGLSNQGSYLLLFTTVILGGMALAAIGLLVASRTQSDELAGGLLNLMTWPMMFLSEVWFSLEGSPEWVQTASKALPLSHFVSVFRGVMTEGMGWSEAAPSLLILGVITVVGLSAGAALFRWQET